MSDFGLFKTFCREVLSRRTQARGPRPSDALAVERVAEALATGGAADGRFASGYLLHTANISQTIAGAANCIDLGAAPGCQLLQIASVNPEIHFFGVDISNELLTVGEKNTQLLGIRNVSWRQDDISSLASFETSSIDAVISTMTLHDLSNLSAVEKCLQAVSRVLKPGGALYIEDYGRLKSRKSVAYFNAVNAAIEGDAFAELNACSMQAAFLIRELSPLFSKYLPRATLHSTFLIPFLNVLKTEPREFSSEKLNQINALRSALGSRQQADLDDLRRFFKLGGWDAIL